LRLTIMSWMTLTAGMVTTDLERQSGLLRAHDP